MTFSLLLLLLIMVMVEVLMVVLTMAAVMAESVYGPGALLLLESS